MNTKYAIGFLQMVLDEEDHDTFLIALKDVVTARTKNISKASRAAGISRQAFNKALSKDDNPTLATLGQILGSVGIKISFAAK